MTKTPHNAENHVVAVFEEADQVRKAIEELRGTGIDDKQISVLARDQVDPESDSPEDLAKASSAAGKGILEGSLAGGGIGAAIGLLGGALAVAIPGLGPALGVGLLVGGVSGAAAGATAGALWSGFERMWDMGYRDLVAGGGVLVAAHTDDRDQAARVMQILRDLGAVRVDLLDKHGEVTREA
jgi:hypothetical protein